VRRCHRLAFRQHGTAGWDISCQHLSLPISYLPVPIIGSECFFGRVDASSRRGLSDGRSCWCSNPGRASNLTVWNYTIQAWRHIPLDAFEITYSQGTLRRQSDRLPTVRHRPRRGGSFSLTREKEGCSARRVMVGKQHSNKASASVPEFFVSVLSVEHRELCHFVFQARYRRREELARPALFFHMLLSRNYSRSVYRK
jgi:hypothetical protein